MVAFLEEHLAEINATFMDEIEINSATEARYIMDYLQTRGRDAPWVAPYVAGLWAHSVRVVAQRVRHTTVWSNQ